jgi:hypothetical protein
MFLNPRRTRAGVRRSGLTGFSQGRRRSAASGQRPGEPELGVRNDQEPGQRSAASGVRSFGVVQPSVCFPNLQVCSRSNLLRNPCQQRW